MLLFLFFLIFFFFVLCLLPHLPYTDLLNPVQFCYLLPFFFFSLVSLLQLYCLSHCPSFNLLLLFSHKIYFYIFFLTVIIYHNLLILHLLCFTLLIFLLSLSLPILFNLLIISIILSFTISCLSTHLITFLSPSFPPVFSLAGELYVWMSTCRMWTLTNVPAAAGSLGLTAVISPAWK